MYTQPLIKRHHLKYYGHPGKESACNAGDLGLIPGLGRSPGEGKGYPLQYPGVENSCSWWGCQESDRTERLSFSLFTLKYKYDYTSNTATCVISREVQHAVSLFFCSWLLPWWLRWSRICLQCRKQGFDPWVGKIHWREWQSTPVFLPGEFPGQRSLAGSSPKGHKESDMTKRLTPSYCLYFKIN